MGLRKRGGGVGGGGGLIGCRCAFRIKSLSSEGDSEVVCKALTIQLCSRDL